MEWHASGMVQSQPQLCFPGDVNVVTRGGVKSIAQVRIGDELLGFNSAKGEVEFSEVRAWLHYQPNVTSPMTRLHTEVGDLVASPMHSLASGTPDNFAFARDFRVGGHLSTPNSSAAIRKITPASGRGIYAPLTWASNFYVGMGADPWVLFLAHSFAHVSEPQRIQAFFHGLLSIAELASPSIHAIDIDAEMEYVHPVARILMWALGMEELPISAPRRLKGGTASDESNEDTTIPDALMVLIDHPPFLMEGTQVNSMDVALAGTDAPTRSAFALCVAGTVAVASVMTCTALLLRRSKKAPADKMSQYLIVS